MAQWHNFHINARYKPLCVYLALVSPLECALLYFTQPFTLYLILFHLLYLNLFHFIVFYLNPTFLTPPYKLLIIFFFSITRND